MNNILNLYNELNKLGVKLYHWNMDNDKAATLEINGQYAVFMDFGNIDTLSEEMVIVAHEEGHICTGATHKVSSPYDLVSKHENKADKWAITRLIPVDEFDAAIAEGYDNIWSLADHFGVTEDFMRKAVCYYVHGNLAVDMYL